MSPELRALVIKARQRIQNKADWARGSLFKDKITGERVLFSDALEREGGPNKCRCCFFGAVVLQNPPDHLQAEFVNWTIHSFGMVVGRLNDRARSHAALLAEIDAELNK